MIDKSKALVVWRPKEDIQGFKGGSSKSEPRTPVEAPDSLHSTAYAKILDLISEGEIEGLVNGRASVFLDETPATNLPGVSIVERKGTQFQSHISGFPAVESEIAVGVELRHDTPYIRSLTNSQLSAVRIRLSTPRLLKQNPKNGDTGGHKVNYTVELATNGGAYQTVLMSAFSGKTTTKYERSHRIDLPPSPGGWIIRITRSGNTSVGTIADTTYVEAITEIIDAKFRYPNSAIIGLEFDASHFSSIPPRAYHCRGRRIRVPVNYDPTTRAYTGVWNGTFKVAYSNNPAWVYFDLLTNDRYGLGHLVNQTQVDKWELYRIAQYCDGSVSNGKGGQEPRFTCNVYLQTQAEALKILQDMASIFRGMSYWGGGVINVLADMPEDPVYVYSNANVIDGKFRYSGTSRKSRYSVALVSWNDPNDFYRVKVEYVEDRESLARFGHRATQVMAFGCTSQGQAQRLGKWILLTNRLEAETVDFSVGLDSTLIRPGSVITVADNNRAGRRLGGRLRNASTTNLVLDAATELNQGDLISVVMPDGTAVSRTIESMLPATTWDKTTISWDNIAITFDQSQLLQEVTLSSPLPAVPPLNSMWAVDSPTLATQKFKVLAIRENFSGDKMQFDVTATRHFTGKHLMIDEGVKIDTPPITVIPPAAQDPVTNIELTSDYGVSQGQTVTTLRIEWTAAPHATAYEIQWKRDDSDWIKAGRTGLTSVEVQGILAGTYMARVQAFNALGIGSPWATSVETPLEAETLPPSQLPVFTASPMIFGIALAWEFPATRETETTQRTEIWFSDQTDLQTAVKLSDFAYPQNSHNMVGLASGVTFYFWARLVDKFGHEGPWTAMVTGMSSAEASEILDYLTGQITESELGSGLLTEIGFISGTGPGSVNGRIDVVKNNLETQLASLESQLAELTGAPDYDPLETYALDDIVKADGALWQALGAVPVSTPPPNATYWKKIGDYASLGDMVTALAAEVNSLSTQVTGLDDDLAAEVLRINNLVTSVGNNASAITAEAQARSTAIDSLTTQLNTQTSRTDQMEAALSQESTTRSDQVSSLALQVDTISATAQGAAQDAQAAQTQAQQAADAAAQAAADAAAAAAGAESVLIQSTTPPVEKRLPTVLWIDTTSNNNTPKRWNGTAWVAITDKAAINAAATAAAAQTAANNAAQTASAASASAQQATTAVATLDGKVAAAWSIKTQVTANNRTYIAGIGVGVSNNSGIVESQVLVSASKFAVLDPNGTAVTSPFAIVGGQTFIQNAIIQNAAIDTLKIQGNAVTIPVAVSSNALMEIDVPRTYLNTWSDVISGTINTQGAPLDIYAAFHLSLWSASYIQIAVRMLINGVVVATIDPVVVADDQTSDGSGDATWTGIVPISFTAPAATGARTVKFQWACTQVGWLGGDFSSQHRYLKLTGTRR
ncbi:tail protein [Pseudomonas phage ZQG1]|nr:tail protein [Pseudomonas phage ZQG1]